MPVLGVFSAEKLIQAAALLLKTVDPHRMSRLRLIKLLYIADRESIAETSRPITCDSVVAMKHGPVLARTYDCIKGIDAAATYWEHYIRRSGPQDVELASDPGVGKLSRREATLLREVSERYAHLDDYDLALLTHEFPEWLKNQPPDEGQRPIAARDILEAVGLGDDADEILDEVRSMQTAHRLLANARE